MLLPVLLLWLLVAENARANLLVPQEVPVISNATELNEKLKELDQSIRDGIETVMKYVLPTLIRANSEVELSSECSSSLVKLVIGIRQFKPWAFEMLDANAKLPSGLLWGTVAEFGVFDQCLAVKVHDEYSPETVQFRGQYCSIELIPPLPPKPSTFKYNVQLKAFENFTTDNYILKHIIRIAHFGYFLGMRFGICLPSVCTKNDIQNMMSSVPIAFTIKVKSCEVETEIVFTALEISIITLFSLFGLFIVIGTAVDVLPKIFHRNDSYELTIEPKTAVRALKCFSANTTILRLMRKENGNNLASLHGIKFFSMTWVIVGHSYLQWNMQMTRSIQKVANDSLPSFSFQAVMNALVAVDTFFFVTGLLVVYITLKAVDTHGKKSFSTPLFIIHRIARLLPSTLGVIAITIIMPHFGSGPVWHETIDLVVENCKKNWWTNALFINNFIEPIEECLPHTWYTATDMQLYFLALIFILILFRKPLLAHIYVGFLVLFSIVSLTVITVWKNLPPTILVSEPDPQGIINLWKVVQFKPHTHVAAYAMGMATGYFLYRHPKFRLHPLIQAVGWLLAIICNLTVLYCTYLWNGSEYATLTEAAVYSGLHRPGWILGLIWMVVMCATGRGGFINSFLSWSALIPLSRLTFMTYLLHTLIEWIFIGNLRGPIDAHQLFAMWLITSNVAITFFVAFLCHVLFEAPVARLYALFIEILLAKKPEKAKKSTEEPSETADNEKSTSTTKLTSDNGNVVYRL